MSIKFVLLAFWAISACIFAPAAAAQTYSIANARIVTVSGGVIERGTVVVRDGLIESVGADVRTPADAAVIDGTGLTVYPGFIDALSTLGVPAAQPQRTQAAPGSTPQPGTATSSNYPAGFRAEERVIDEIRSGEDQFEANRNAGFTTALTTGRSGIFSGQSALINLAGDSVSSMVVKSPVALHMSFATVGGGQYPASLLGTFSAFRQLLLDARRHQALLKQYAADPRGMRRPPADLSLEAVIPILDRQIPVVFNANRENEIIRALDLAKELNLRAIIAGGQEAWKVAGRLKEQDVPVLLSLNFPKRTAATSPEADEESMEILRFRAEAPKGPARLANAGVRFAFQTGGMTSLGDYFTNGGKAVDNGLSRDQAVRAMTLSAAEIFGVGDRTGTVDAGKIANLAIVKGDLFAKDRTVTHVFVDGKLFEPKQQPKPAAGAPGAQPAATTSLASVGGNYSITVEIPGQPMPGTIALVQQAAILSGTLSTQFGTSPIKDGKVTAEGFTFGASVEYGGSTIEIVVSGIVAGDQISGTIDSPQGAIPFSGTRNP